MTTPYDLHAHSTASDGTLSPTELMTRGHEAGIQTMALTDHDSTEGVAEAKAQADKLGMGFVPGVEISVSWNGMTIHMLGLGVDINSEPLQTGLAGLREFRDSRAQLIGERLGKAGIADAYQGAKDIANGGLISRTHFARFLVEKGHAKDVRDVFKHFLVNNKPGHVGGKWADLEEAIAWVKEAKGQAVIAHPARYRATRSKLRKLFRDFKEFGGEGLEVVSGSHSKNDFFTIAQHAKDFDLSASAGSDFHDPNTPWIRLGNLPEIPRGCRPIWHDWPRSH